MQHFKEARMPTQYRLPLQPAGAEDVNDVLAIQRAKDQVAYFAAGVPVFTHAAGDRVGLRLPPGAAGGVGGGWGAPPPRRRQGRGGERARPRRGPGESAWSYPFAGGSPDP